MGILEQTSISSYNDRVVHISQGDLTDLRRRAAYYQAQFEIKKRKLERLIQFCREQKNIKAKLWHLLFGKKSETSKNSDATANPKGGKRGKKAGDKGVGRQTEDALLTKVEVIALPIEEQLCPCCGLMYEDKKCTSDSEIIEVEVSAHRRIIKRNTYGKTCDCKEVPDIIRAPPPAKLISKGKFGVSFWTYVLLQKFCYHMPINRILGQLANYGLRVSAGTIVGGLKKIKNLLLPIYQAIEERNQSEHHWHADETRWMVFASFKDKSGHRWYVWVFKSDTTVFFKISPTRGAQVVKDHFKNSFGIISADRYAAYKTLLDTGLFLIAYCWAHVRRDFLDVAKGSKEFSEWAKVWVERINFLYHINNQRIKAAADSEEFQKHQAELQKEILTFHSQFEEDLVQCQSELSSIRRAVLQSLKNHWNGLTIFVQFSWVPMDNNPAEQAVRDPVLGRKNYYGSGSVESADLAGISFTAIATIELWGLNTQLWMSSYFQACAENKGQPPKNLAPFLPWQMTEDEIKKYGGAPSKIPKAYSEITKEQIKCVIVDESFQKKKSKLSKPLSEKPQSRNAGPMFQENCVDVSTGKNQTEVSKKWPPELHSSRWKRMDSSNYRHRSAPKFANKEPPR